MKMKLLAIVCFIIAGTAHGKDNTHALKTVLTPFVATYVATMNGRMVDDNAKQRLTYQGNGNYTYSALAKNILFELEDYCSFSTSDNRIKPLKYKSSRGSIFKKNKKHVAFDWQRMQAQFQSKKWKGELPLEENSLAPQCTTLELARQLMLGNTQMNLVEVTPGKSKPKRFKVVGEERIKLPYGDVETVKVKRISLDNEKQTYIWFAPALNYLAVKVEEHTTDNDTYKLQLKAVNTIKPIL